MAWYHSTQDYKILEIGPADLVRGLILLHREVQEDYLHKQLKRLASGDQRLERLLDTRRGPYGEIETNLQQMLNSLQKCGYLLSVDEGDWLRLTSLGKKAFQSQLRSEYGYDVLDQLRFLNDLLLKEPEAKA